MLYYHKCFILKETEFRKTIQQIIGWRQNADGGRRRFFGQGRTSTSELLTADARLTADDDQIDQKQPSQD